MSIRGPLEVNCSTIRGRLQRWTYLVGVGGAGGRAVGARAVAALQRPRALVVQRRVAHLIPGERVEGRGVGVPDEEAGHPEPPTLKSPPFLGCFSPKFRPFYAILRPSSPSWRQEAGNRERTAKRRRKTGEEWPRNSG